MFIPIIPTTSTLSKELMVGKLSFEGLIPIISGELKDYRTITSDIVSKFSDKQPILVVDVKGIKNKTINDVLLKGLKIRGAQIWFMTCIETVDDVFDAFNTDADYVLMPYHMIRNNDELKDIIMMSDSSIPAIFVKNGKAQCIRGNTDPNKLVEELSDMGFKTIAVFDITGDLNSDDWKDLASEGRIIPFSEGKEKMFEEIGLEWSFRSTL